MLSTKELLVNAKNVLLEKGWVQGEYGTKDGYCAVGAVDAVVEELLRNDEVTDDEAYSLYQSGENALRATLVETDRIANIVFWNDARHRTQQDVLDLFDLAAQRAAGV
jgi:hypothetical protein